MTTMTTTIERNHAIDNAQAWWESIRDMVGTRNAALEAHDDRAYDKAAETITESVLSVMVRDGWHAPGAKSENGPEEYEILLTTGGPALRLYGKLDHWGEPDLDPMLQWQDWGTPWTDYWPPNASDVPYKATLREFARWFYFGD